jgi:YnbE-like lipoprotein
MRRSSSAAVVSLFIATAISACSPVVRVEPPREPITINLNVKLDADVRVKLEEQAKRDVAKNPEIF